MLSLDFRFDMLQWSGSLFSWSVTSGYYQLGFPFGHHFVFFVIAASVLVCLIIGFFTPRTLDKQPETWDLMKKVSTCSCPYEKGDFPMGGRAFLNFNFSHF